jgi:RHS repeat-associated protein
MVALNKTYRETLTPDRSAKDSGHRFYSAEISRWLNRDPIGEAGGLSVYVFVGNNPSDHFDLIGLVDERGLVGAIDAQIIIETFDDDVFTQAAKFALSMWKAEGDANVGPAELVSGGAFVRKPGYAERAYFTFDLIGSVGAILDAIESDKLYCIKGSAEVNLSKVFFETKHWTGWRVLAEWGVPTKKEEKEGTVPDAKIVLKAEFNNCVGAPWEEVKKYEVKWTPNERKKARDVADADGNYADQSWHVVFKQSMINATVCCKDKP